MNATTTDPTTSMPAMPDVASELPLIQACILEAAPLANEKPLDIRQLAKRSGYALSSHFRTALDALLKTNRLVRTSKGVYRPSLDASPLATRPAAPHLSIVERFELFVRQTKESIAAKELPALELATTAKIEIDGETFVVSLAIDRDEDEMIRRLMGEMIENGELIRTSQGVRRRSDT